MATDRTDPPTENESGTGDADGKKDTVVPLDEWRRDLPPRQRRGESRLLLPANDSTGNDSTGGGGGKEPAFNLPPVAKTVALILVACFLLFLALPERAALSALAYGAFVPARYTGGIPFDLPALWTPVTYAFFHGGWLHLGVNAGMLMAFGAAIEQQRGGRYLLLVFFGGTLAAAAGQLLFYPHSHTPMIGASGGISALFGAALMEMARRQHGDHTPLRQRFATLAPFILIWVAVSVIFGVTGLPGDSASIAWAAHIGGFAGGIALGAMRPRPAGTRRP